uniref:FAD_binding_7 domain-containing protein n=1 Tax=Macrostomum lignano TaxID=282301 RepID=A0A1I8FKY1_9PLAT
VSMPASLATTAERQLAAPRPAPAALADRAVRVYRHDGQSRTVPVGRDTPHYACWQLVEVCASLPGPALRRRALQDSVTIWTVDCREAAVDLLQLDPRRLAQLLTESDAEAHRQIRPADLVLWWLGNRDGSSYKSLTAFHRANPAGRGHVRLAGARTRDLRRCQHRKPASSAVANRILKRLSA